MNFLKATRIFWYHTRDMQLVAHPRVFEYKIPIQDVESGELGKFLRVKRTSSELILYYSRVEPKKSQD
jgi:hypothetical protein